MELLIEIIKINPWWQLFGFLAMLVAFIWLMQKDDNQTVKIVIVSQVLWIIHFFLMWLYSTMLVSIIWILRLFLSLKYKKNTKVFLAIIIALFIAWISTFENKLSILPIVWSVLTAYWYFFCEWFRLRLFIFISSIFWLSFNLNVGSVWWVINEIISQLILIFVMYNLIRSKWVELNFIQKIKWLFKRKKEVHDFDKFFPIADYKQIENYSIKFKINKPNKNRFTKNELKLIKQSVEK